MRFIDQFQIILPDMASTFMFDVYRFSETEDFARTYQRIGGTQLSGREVKNLTQRILRLWGTIMKRQLITTAFLPHVTIWKHSLRHGPWLPRERAPVEHVFTRH